MYKLYSKEDVDYIKKNYAIIGSKLCAKYLQRDIKSVIAKANSIGMKTDKNSLSRLNQSKDIKYLNINYFDFINVATNYHAYLLGFLWGDGYINKKGKDVKINICESDALLLKSTIMKTGNWSIQIHKARKKTYQRDYVFYSRGKRFWEFLHSLNYDQKSNINHKQILEYIPKPLQHMWLRGLIDADGCFCKGKKQAKNFSISGPYSQDWDELLQYFKISDIKLKIYRYKKGKSAKSKIVSEDFSNIEKIGLLIYPDGWDEIGLKRKYDKWLEIMQSAVRFDISDKTSRLLKLTGF